MSTFTPKPEKCDCTTPIWRFIDEHWQCLNCPLHVAIVNRDDTERSRLIALIDATKPARRAGR